MDGDEVVATDEVEFAAVGLDETAGKQEAESGSDFGFMPNRSPVATRVTFHWFGVLSIGTPRRKLMKKA